MPEADETGRLRPVYGSGVLERRSLVAGLDSARKQHRASKDTDGDGKAEIIVRGFLHANAPKEAGGGTVDREVVLVFQLQGDAIKRIFAAEVGRKIGSNKVTGVISFASNSIEVGPGKFTGWTEKTYPFNQDISAVGGYEPLIIPWSGAKSVKYKWKGSSFAK